MTALGVYRGAPVARSGFGSNATAPTYQVACLHDTEGAYEGAISWMKSQQNGSYHRIRALAGQGAQLVAESRQSWSAMTIGNRIGLHLCLEGYAVWTRAQWLTKGADGLEGLAHDLADWNRTHALPLVRLIPAQVKAGVRGVCTHADISAAFRESDHTDPGALPVDLVIARARELVAGSSNLLGATDAELAEMADGLRQLGAS